MRERAVWRQDQTDYRNVVKIHYQASIPLHEVRPEFCLRSVRMYREYMVTSYPSGGVGLRSRGALSSLREHSELVVDGQNRGGI